MMVPLRLCRDRALPAFRLGAKLFGMRKSTFLAWMAERERETLGEVKLRDNAREIGELNRVLAKFGIEEALVVPEVA